MAGITNCGPVVPMNLLQAMMRWRRYSLNAENHLSSWLISDPDAANGPAGAGAGAAAARGAAAGGGAIERTAAAGGGKPGCSRNWARRRSSGCGAAGAAAGMAAARGAGGDGS